jgi:hypothetical protein
MPHNTRDLTILMVPNQVLTEIIAHQEKKEIKHQYKMMGTGTTANGDWMNM